MKKSKNSTAAVAAPGSGTVSIKNTPKEKKTQNAAAPSNKVRFINADALIFTGIAIVFFLILRSYFPIPDIIADSRGYMLGAVTDSEVGYRPMGISFLLEKIHNLNSSVVAVAYFQFILHVFSALALAHAFLVHFKFSATGKRILYGVLLLNPILLHLCNAIFSDSLFISLNLGWMAMLLYLIKKPSWLVLGALLLMLWMSMFVRYNALVYPFAIAASLLLIKNKPIKWAGIIGSFAVGLLFYTITADKMDQITDHRVLSGFSGWQMGTNAMTIYKAKPRTPIVTDDKVIAGIDAMCRKYIDTMAAKDPKYRQGPALDFLWGTKAPFKVFEHILIVKTMATDPFKNWVATSVILNKYGLLVIKQYPLDFIQYYLLPNAWAYLFPDLEVVKVYNAPTVETIPDIMQWYGLPKHITSNHINLPGIYNKPSQFLYSGFTILFIIGSIVWLAKRKKWGLSDDTEKVLFTVIIFWLCKTAFDILAAPCVLRYEVMLISIFCAPLLVYAQLFTASMKGNKEVVQGS